MVGDAVRMSGVSDNIKEIEAIVLVSIHLLHKLLSIEVYLSRVE